jgi:phage-related protein
VREAIGYALFTAQQGRKAPSAKPMKGIVRGAGVLQIADQYDGETFRVVYTVSFPGAVYVLHAFQKKSRSGIRTARHDVDLIRRRLETARTDYESRRP